MIKYIQQNSSLPERSISNTLDLLNEGASIPFISRYRKEATNGLDEVQIQQIRDLSKKYQELVQRKESIAKSIDEQGKLTPELQQTIAATWDLLVLEDLYLPYKQKRLTRSEKARKLGLEPLAKMIMAQRGGDPIQMASKFLNKEVIELEEALQGAKDIIADFMNTNLVFRQRMRDTFERKSNLVAKVVKAKKAEAEKYSDYFDFNQAASRIPAHRFLAIHRAHSEGLITFKLGPDKDAALDLMDRFFVKSTDACGDLVKQTCKDAYDRLIAPSLETELLSALKLKADLASIEIFSTNLSHLLLAPPLGQKRILALDPGFRTGCKLVCLDERGNLLVNATIYPHAPQNEKAKAQAKIYEFVEAYKIDAIAIGDGTAGRETESLIKHMRFKKDIEVYSVREDGASIYSASPIARKEFPDYDVTVRGAISIGRRLMDPLAELVKIDPKSVGVGQYQHEVDQKLLKQSLEDVVVNSVNSVGVDLNTASPHLLSYVSGLGETLAENIVAYRTENGGFKSRAELKKVKRLGDKAFEQCAGFLRIRDGENPLDSSAVHPESYHLVEKIAKQRKINLRELMGNESLLNSLAKSDFPQIDPFTFEDIIQELKKPGRDPRQKAKAFEFDPRIKTIQDLEIGMVMQGIVTNVTAFGAFANIGLKENGLIHKSKLANVYVDNPSDFIRLHEQIEVRIIEIDLERKRIALERIMEK